jgi:hypothetical protein
MIPFLIKSVNGYDINELERIKDYCFEHADRAARGEHVVNDLVKSGLVNSTFYDWSCSMIDDELDLQGTLEGVDRLNECLASGFQRPC